MTGMKDAQTSSAILAAFQLKITKQWAISAFVDFIVTTIL
jgi:hypothetical protein